MSKWKQIVCFFHLCKFFMVEKLHNNTYGTTYADLIIIVKLKLNSQLWDTLYSLGVFVFSLYLH